MASGRSSVEPLEREGERELLAAAVQQAARAGGSVVLVEGAAGIGKTVLLDGARELAGREGLTVLTAVGSPLDREFPFGVVHQLLDPPLAAASESRRARLLAGAAAHAARVLLPAADDGAAEPAPSHTVLHGLYWFVANLAEEEPLVLVADDLHCADLPSLRFLEFLGRRLQGLPILLVGAARPDEQALLGALAQGPAATTLRPRSLSEGAAARVLATALAAEVEPAFVTACLEATGGNPLLLRELARTAAEQGLEGSAAEAGEVPSLRSADLAGIVRRRLVALGPDAVAVAEAAAILGERAERDDLAAVAGLDAAATAAAADELERAEILRGDACGFVHPLVAETVAADVPRHRRAALHARAAARLRARGARREEIAVQLLATEPAGDPAIAATLRAAARAAVAAPDTAVDLLRRALREPPAPAERAATLLELGELESQAGDTRAPARLASALAEGLPADGAARAHAARARLSILADPRAAAAELEDAIALAQDPQLCAGLQTLLLSATAYDGRLQDRRDVLLAAARAEADPSPLLLAHLLVESAYRGEPAEVTAALAHRTFDDDALLRSVGLETSTFNLAAGSLRHAELAELGDRVLAAGERAAREHGSRLAVAILDHARAFWHLSFGSMIAGEGHARSGLALVEGMDLTVVSMVTVLAELLIERGQVDEAEARLGALGDTTAVRSTIIYPDYLSARAEVHRERGRREDAERDLREARGLIRARGWRTPLKSLAGVRLIDVLGERGARDEALAVAAEEEEAVRRIGTPGVIGMVARARGCVLEDGDERVAALSEAAELLSRSPLRLEHGWALHDLGAALRRVRRVTEAREPLRGAVEIGQRIGATRLAEAAYEELLASGARPRRTALTGAAALTPSERRVADLAAQGMTNREIAETLWVTRKTVEVHLGHAYAKLGIRARSEIAASLAQGQGKMRG